MKEETCGTCASFIKNRCDTWGKCELDIGLNPDFVEDREESMAACDEHTPKDGR